MNNEEIKKKVLDEEIRKKVLDKEIRKQVLEEINKKWIAFISSNISAEDCISDTIDLTIALMKSEQEKDEIGKIAIRLKDAIVCMKDGKCSACEVYRTAFADSHINIDKCPYHQGMEEGEKQERQALLGKIDELYKKHKNCKPVGFLCLEQFKDELKQSVGTEKDYTEDKAVSEGEVMCKTSDTSCHSSEIPTLLEKIDKVVDEEIKRWERYGYIIETKCKVDDKIIKFSEELKQKLKEVVR